MSYSNLFHQRAVIIMSQCSSYHRSKCILFQWQITDRCNHRCLHCYQESYSNDGPSYDDLLGMLQQFKTLLTLRKRQIGDNNLHAHVILTGGEPFIRDDFMSLVETIAAQKDDFSFSVLTNGSLINRSLARYLRFLAPDFVQVSIDGTKETHDSIRGTGDFDRTVSAVKHLVKANIRTLVSFTANRDNYREFESVGSLGRKLGVSRVWADRLIPCGRGLGMKEKILSADETKHFFEIMARAQKKVSRRLFNKTEIAMHRALQFLVGGGMPYQCIAGDDLLNIMPNGDVYPCRRMPIKVGNLWETPLQSIYYENELLITLRSPNSIPRECQSCPHGVKCRGGLRCLSYATKGNLFHADPGCWKANASGNAC